MEENLFESGDSQTARDKKKSLVSLSVYDEFDDEAGESTTSGKGKQKTGGSSFLDLHNRMKHPRMMLSFWLMDLLSISKSPSRLKVFLPFVVTFDLVMSRLPPVTNMLDDIAERLRVKNNSKGSVMANRALTSQSSLARLRCEGSVSHRSLADLEPGVKIPVHLLIQTYVDLLLLHGAMDNCYVSLMKCGENEDSADAPMIVRKKSGIIKRFLQTGKSKEEKRVAQWSKFYGRINAPKLGLPEFTAAESHTHKLDSSIALQSKSMLTNTPKDPTNDTGNATILAMEVGDDSKEDVDDTGEKKKKKGLKKKLIGSVRWMNGKKKDPSEKVKTSKAKKMKKIFLSRKGDNKKLDDIATTTSRSSCSLENEFGSDSTEKLVSNKITSNDKPRYEARGISLGNVESHELSAVSEVPEKIKKSFKKKVTTRLGLTNKKSSSKVSTNESKQTETDVVQTSETKEAKKEKIKNNKTEENDQKDDKEKKKGGLKKKVSKPFRWIKTKF